MTRTKSSSPLTQERLKQILEYNPETGLFVRLKRRGNLMTGPSAGTEQQNGYLSATIGQRRYLIHRLAWFYMTGQWPKEDIDHINGNRSDNRFCNLREASRSLNMRNIPKFKSNKAGFKGVTYKAGLRRKRWRATISIDGRQKSLGVFATPEEAHAAYIAAAREHFGEFARAS